MTSLMAWEREEREESALPMAVCVHACEIECMLDVKRFLCIEGRRRGGRREGRMGEEEEGGEEEWERRREEGRKNGRGGGRKGGRMERRRKEGRRGRGGGGRGRKEEEGVIYQRNHYCSERSLQWQHR